MRDHFEVNTLGPQLLFQTFAPLLFASSAPHFVAISTTVGSISMKLPIPAAAYGASKAALNYLVAQISIQHTKNNLCAYAISPGHVNTDLGNRGAQQFGLDEAPVKLHESVTAVLGIVDKATVDATSGRFWDYTGKELQW